MTTTTNLGLTTYDTASGSATTFLNYRLSQNGLSSNMTIIDTFAGTVNDSISILQQNTYATIAANQVSGNYFEGFSTVIPSYLTNMPINLRLNATISGSTTLNINSFGVKELKKVSLSGSLVDLVSGDLKLNNYYPFIYNGTYFVAISPTSTGSSTSGSTSFSTSGSVTDRHLVIYDGSSGSQVRDGFGSVDTSGNLSLGGNQIRNYSEQVVTNSGSVTYNIDWSAGNLFEITLTGNKSITFSNLVAGRSITAMMKQDGTGSRIVTWPSVKWTSGSPMVLSTGSACVDVVSFFVASGGSNVYGFPAGMDMK